MKKTLFFALIFLGFFIFTQTALASTIFSDGFESGDFSAWTNSGVGWAINTTNAHSGTKKTLVAGDTNGDSDLQKNISSSGYENLVLSYWYKTQNSLEVSDHVYVDWSIDGTNWNNLADYTSTSTPTEWTQVVFNLPSGAENNSNFSFRFRANLGSLSDELRLDDVALEGSILLQQTCGNQVVEGAEQCDGGTCCAGDCTFKQAGTSCSDGLYCNGQETCDASGACANGSLVDCFGNNISAVNSCVYNPDDNPFTLDLRNLFESACVEDGGNAGHCTQGDSAITHACDKSTCGAECETGDSQACTAQGGYSGTQDCSAGCSWNSCQTALYCGDGIVNGAEQCDGGICCAGDCTFKQAGTSCSDGLYCNGQEACDAGGVCQPGAAVSCSTSNIVAVSGCDTATDSNVYTNDYRPYFESVCNEETDNCTTGDETVTHVCSVSLCQAPCEPGGAAACTAECQIQSGSITIIKNVIPDSGQDFTFTRSFGKQFILDDDSDPVRSNTIIFNNLEPGTYSISEKNKYEDEWALTGINCTGGQATRKNRRVTITLSAGENVVCTFENTKYSSISGFKYNDKDGDNQWDGWWRGEHKMVDWKIFIDENDNDKYDRGEPFDITSGFWRGYWLGELSAGSYKVCEVMQRGWQSTAPDNAICKQISVAVGEDKEDVNFGNQTIHRRK